MMTKELVSIQKNEYKGLQLRSIALFPWLLYRLLKFRSAFEEGLKVMRRYTLLTDSSALGHEVGLVAPKAYVHEAMNLEK